MDANRFAVVDRGNRLADVLREHIRATGLNSTRLALEARMFQPIIHRFRKGEASMSLKSASKLCEFLGLDILPKNIVAVYEAVYVKTIEMFYDLEKGLRKDGATLPAARVRRYAKTVLEPALSELRQQLGGGGDGGNPRPAADAGDAPKDAKDTEDAEVKDTKPKERDRQVDRPVNKLPRRVVKVTKGGRQE
jgi:hypothetical protein